MLEGLRFAQVNPEAQKYVLELIWRVGIFCLGALVSPLVGQWFLRFLQRGLVLFEYFLEIDAKGTYNQFIRPLQASIRITGSLLVTAVLLNLVTPYERFSTFLRPLIYLALAVTLSWLLVSIIKQVIRQIFIHLMRGWLGTVNQEIIFIFEVLIYVFFGIIAVIITIDNLEVIEINEAQKEILEFAFKLGAFLLGVALSPVVGRFVPTFFRQMLRFSQRYVDIDAGETYNRFVAPFNSALVITGTLLFIALCLNLLISYPDLYTFLGFFVYLTLSISIVWLSSKVARQIIRRSIISLVQRWFGDANEVVLVFETLVYILIIVIAIVIFTLGLRLNPMALITSLGIAGGAIALGSQHSLSRIFGTLELYLDRPYLPGEYVRVNFKRFGEDVYGRIESIGLRSTKIRIVAHNTLMIVPNSMMAGMNIENISRGKKIMAMLCLDFMSQLQEREKSLVQQIVEETSQVFWGLDKASTRIQFEPCDQHVGTRARVIFFITGSSESSIALRKRLLELANDAIARRLAGHKLSFTTPEPLVYIDSPMSI